MAKILIVDDDVELVQSLTALLEGSGYETLSANDGDAGFQKAKTLKPDLVLLDVMMRTDSEGFEVARRMKEDEATRKIPVIILSGIRKAKSLPFAFEPDEDWLPVRAVLEKPVKPEHLMKMVEEVLKAR